MITLVSIESEDAQKLLEKKDRISLPLIEEACKILEIKYISVGNVFIDKKETDQTTALKNEIDKSLSDKININYTIFYCNLNRNHPRYEYYNLIGVSSNQVVDIKKIMKIHKLKAFL